ncbi:U2-type spliceosomal complex subunit CWC21 [Sporobolomyces salmoneus]|uniref:U2-type spliceosomal complex subunit CWC21 n=1 Tax=Sporobolomyces salmoneus TaxID=183962 RepID=UPI00316C74BD
MSYNGVGLATPRGSGTSGHIQANRSNLRSRPQFDKSHEDRDRDSRSQHRAPDQSILDHERKRRIEAKCFELQVSLEDEGLLSSDQIQEKVDELRTQLLSQSNAGQKEGFIKPSERHELAQAKQIQDEKFRKALGIKEGHVEGLAFDRDAQAEIKRQKAEERERHKEERAKIQKDLEKAREQAFERRKVLDRERKEHEETMRRERIEYEEKMRQDRRKMEAEVDPVPVQSRGLVHQGQEARSLLLLAQRDVVRTPACDQILVLPLLADVPFPLVAAQDLGPSLVLLLVFVVETTLPQGRVHRLGGGGLCPVPVPARDPSAVPVRRQEGELRPEEEEDVEIVVA